MTTLLLTNRLNRIKLIGFLGIAVFVAFVVVYLKAFDHSPKWVESAGLPYDAVLSNQNKNLKYDKETGALIWPDSLEVIGMSSYTDTTKPKPKVILNHYKDTSYDVRQLSRNIVTGILDTTKPSHQDTVNMQNAFVKKFTDTATFGRFQAWLYERISAKEYNNFINLTSQYYNAYLRERYEATLKK